MKIKLLVAFCLIVLVYQKWDVIDRHFNPIPDYAAAHDGKVILYGTSWCGYCEKTRALLNENHIDFYEYDIELSTEGREQYDRLEGKGVPLLLINGKLVRGFDKSEILYLANRG